jgi:hypothetical protein
MKKYLAPVVALLIFASCTTKDNKPANFDYGKVESNKYVNSYFGMEMDIPADWFVQDQETLDNLTKVGKNMIAGDDENMQAVIKASEINTANLLAVYQHEYGTPVAFNANFILIAENLKKTPGIRTGRDYLTHARRLLEQSQFKYDHLDEEFEKEIVGGAEFYKMKADVSFAGVDIHQVYYSTILKDFSFNVIVSYSDESQKQEVLKVIQSMSFAD